MATYEYRVDDLPPAVVTAHDDEAATAMAWALILDDQRHGVQDRALPAILTTSDGTVLLEVTVADVEKRIKR